MPVTPEQSLLEVLSHALNARNIEHVFARLHANVDLPNGMVGGRVTGRENVCPYWTRQWEMMDPHVDPVAFRTDDDADGHARSNRN
jgi:hypothetical protein